MSWGTTFDAEIYIDRASYNTLWAVEEEIKSIQETLQDIRERILMYCASGSRGVHCKDCEDNPLNPVDALHKEVKDLLSYYDEEQKRLYDLCLLKEDWDEKENKFKTAEVG